MKPTLFLRIAAILTLLFCTVHTIGGVFGKPPPGAQADMAHAMQSTAFPMFGVIRTFWDFNIGYGVTFALVLLFHAVLFWQLAGIVKTHAYVIRPVLVTLFLEFLGMAPVMYRYFFLGPCIFSALIALCIAIAFFTAHPAAS